jgi:urease accessory protein
MMVSLQSVGGNTMRAQGDTVIATTGRTADPSSIGRTTSCSRFSWLGAGALCLIAQALAATPASAHHVMGKRVPQTMIEGLLSGLGHPIIGPDHLAFIVALGIAAGMVGSGPALIAAFVASSTAGVLLHLAQLDVPMIEPLVAASVLVAGAALAWRRTTGSHAWIVFAALAGLLHGYAFGESIVGAERTALGGYLVGLALIAACIAAAAAFAARRLVASHDAQARGVRWAGVALAGVGALLLASTFAVS